MTIKNLRYDSDGFIQTVTKNLLDPKHSGGPKTKEGKRVVRLNALQHGLNVRGILPCKKHQCFYASVCPLLNEVKELPEHCAIELAKYQMLHESLQEREDKLCPNLHEFIILQLRLDRLDKVYSLEPELAYEDRFSYHDLRINASLQRQYMSLLNVKEQKVHQQFLSE